jgi:hypothetical protein
MVFPVRQFDVIGDLFADRREGSRKKSAWVLASVRVVLGVTIGQSRDYDLTEIVRGQP